MPIHAFLIAEAAANAGSGNILSLFLPLILMFVLMYFLMMRPQKKREQELRKQLDSMAVGDDVVSIGGIVGRVHNINGDEVTIATSVSRNTITLKKSAINTVIKAGGARSTASSSTAAESQKEKSGGFLGKLLGHHEE